MLEVKCPTCGRPMAYVPELAHREVYCVGCGSHFVVREPELESPRIADQPAVAEKPAS